MKSSCLRLSKNFGSFIKVMKVMRNSLVNVLENISSICSNGVLVKIRSKFLGSNYLEKKKYRNNLGEIIGYRCKPIILVEELYPKWEYGIVKTILSINLKISKWIKMIIRSIIVWD